MAGRPFWTALARTLQDWAGGLALAIVAAVLAGLVIGLVPGLRALTASTIEFLRPIPSVALVPLAVLIYGVGLESKATASSAATAPISSRVGRPSQIRSSTVPKSGWGRMSHHTSRTLSIACVVISVSM